MGGRRDYRRWDYDDETEITLDLEDTRSSLAASAETLSNATFSPPNVLLAATNSSPIRSREGCGKRCRKTSIKKKAQILVVSATVLLVGFIVGFGIGIRERGGGGGGSRTTSRHSKHFSSISNDPLSSSSHEHNDLIFHELLQQISAQNIRDNLKAVTKEQHGGTEKEKEGHEMAIVIRDLWRSYGAPSVRVEHHKALLTKTKSFNFVEILDENGTVLETTTKVGEEDINLPNFSGPIVAFSPPADLNGSLVYGNYGKLEDFERLKKSLNNLDGSVVLVKFGPLHPSTVAMNAAVFGCKGLIFYPDPEDFGPQLPATAVRRASLLTVGQVHEYQKRKGELRTLPAHTISQKDAEKLLRMLNGTEKVPEEWIGGLNVSYHLGGGSGRKVRLRIFNEAQTTNIFNVVAAFPGSIESDRYVIIGCSHDSWSQPGSATDPGIGLALTTELLRAFSIAWAAGWRPRRSLLVVSWDGNLHAASGMSHWLQEHHFEVAQRTVAYIDMTRTLKGNQSLEVLSSPLLKEVARKAINKIKHSGAKMPSAAINNVHWNTLVSSDEPAFTFIGNLGIPFIRLCVRNAPERYNYPLLHTEFDTFDNFVALVDSEFRISEALGRIIAEIAVLLTDSSALPVSLHDYVKDLRKEFDHFMAEYHDDFQKANLSYAQLQSSVRKLEITEENFKVQSRNRTNENREMDNVAFHHRKLRREMEHRILNDKLISVEKALLTRNSEGNDGYKHQIIGHVGSDMAPERPIMVTSTSTTTTPHGPSSHSLEQAQSHSHLVNNTADMKSSGRERKVHSRRVFTPQHIPGSFFPNLRLVLECRRRCEKGETCISQSFSFPTNLSDGESTDINRTCNGWKNMAAQRISSLAKSLEAVSAIIQSPLVVTATQPQFTE